MARWQEKFKGLIWQVEQQIQSSGKLFEVARRTPGVRIMIINDDQILLNKEKRHELGGVDDIRIPGGKLFDDIDEWLGLRNKTDKMLEVAKQAAVAEAKEECGVNIEANDLEFLKKDINGGKGEWDLYYFIVTKFTVDPNGPAYKDTEANEISGWSWYPKEQALKLALDYKNGMSESRSARYVAAWANS